MDETQYITEPITGPMAWLEEYRLEAINRPDFLTRQKEAAPYPERRAIPDGLYVHWSKFTKGDEAIEVCNLADEGGCILTFTQLKELVNMVMEIYDYLDDEQIEQINLNRREREFMEWVESNNGRSYQDVMENRYKKKQKHEPKPKRGYVYVIEGQGFYKIGRAKDANARLAHFGTKLPFPIEVVCVIESEDYVGLEAKLHRRYKSKRVNGEWFDLVPEDLEYLKSLAA